MDGQEQSLFKLTHEPRKWILSSGMKTLAKSMDP